MSTALLVLTAACEEGEPAPVEQAAAGTQRTSAPAPAGEGAEEQVLTGVVGVPGNPDAFTITLTDASGQEVSTLPAGDYQIRVTDLSDIHNFHLTGQGVDESTQVPGTGEAVWDVTLGAGEYAYVCDPHPSMRGSFTVT